MKRVISEPALVGTLRFVFIMGASFMIGWLLMFVLLKDRW